MVISYTIILMSWYDDADWYNVIMILYNISILLTKVTVQISSITINPSGLHGFSGGLPPRRRRRRRGWWGPWRRCGCLHLRVMAEICGVFCGKMCENPLKTRKNIGKEWKLWEICGRLSEDLGINTGTIDDEWCSMARVDFQRLDVVEMFGNDVSCEICITV